MRNKCIYVYGKDLNPSGIKIILEHLSIMLDKKEYKLLCVSSLKTVHKTDFVIPYGILASISLFFHGYRCRISLLIDAVSIGLISETNYYRHKKVLSWRKMLLNYLRAIVFAFLEVIVLFFFKKIVLVSSFDKKYFLKNPLSFFYKHKIIVVKNGVDLPVNYSKKNNREYIKNRLNMGIISYWTDGAFVSLKCFLDEYSSLLYKDFPYLRLIVAGRALSCDMRKYIEKFPNVDILGEVDCLNDFFELTDVSLIVLPKKSGILNKVLDAMAYGVPVLGLPNAFNSLEHLPHNAYYTFEDYSTLKKSIEALYNPLSVEDAVETCLKYIKEHHNWNRNYQYLTDILIKEFIDE